MLGKRKQKNLKKDGKFQFYERNKIKIKDLKSFNAPIYISHHKKKREEGSKSDSFLRSNTLIFSPLGTLSNK